jgi:beta-lactamase class C
MRKIILSALITAMLNVAANGAETDVNQSAIKSVVDNIIQTHLARNNLPGAAVDVYYNGHEYQYFYGVANKSKHTPISKDTIFELASISKVFTTSMLAIEVKKGKIQLTDPIKKYLPDLAASKGLPIDNVSVLNLATHTASLPRQVEQLGVNKNDEKVLMAQLKQWRPSYSIGTQYKYSNISFGLLGVVVANAAGMNYMDLLRQEVLSPLNMENTLIKVPASKTAQQAQGYNGAGNPSAPFVTSTFLYGGGSLRSTPADMLQFLKANMNIQTASATSDLLSAMQFAQQAQYTVRPNFVMALGWQRITRNGNLFITKNGANQGFTSFIGFSPDRKFGVVVLINQAKSKANKAGNQILNQLAVLK